MMRAEDLTKTLEQTFLLADSTDDAFRHACVAVRELHVAAFYVRPERLSDAVEQLSGCDVKPAVVIDYPAGRSTTLQRIAAAEQAVDRNAGEIDLVLNYHGMLTGEYGAVRDDLSRVIRAARARAANVARGQLGVTVTVEAARLGEKLTRLACLIVDEVGADFAGSGTGEFGAARVEDVEIMRDALSEAVGVRAAGAVEGLAAVQDLVGAGAARVATADAATVLDELAELNGGSR